MDLAIKEIKHLAANTDETTRQQLMATLHRLAYSMECPNDTSLRYGHLVIDPQTDLFPKANNSLESPGGYDQNRC